MKDGPNEKSFCNIIFYTQVSFIFHLERDFCIVRNNILACFSGRFLLYY